MNSLSKVIVFFAVLGVIGAGLLLFPQSPLNYKTLVVVAEVPAETEQEPAAGTTSVSSEPQEMNQ